MTALNLGRLQFISASRFVKKSATGTPSTLSDSM
jgi:hypothetical protein